MIQNEKYLCFFDELVSFFQNLPGRLEYQAEKDKNSEEGEVEESEFYEIAKGVSRGLLIVFLERDKARKRGDKRARAADVDTEQKLAVILRKL